jgi:hypothetical protein
LDMFQAKLNHIPLILDHNVVLKKLRIKRHEQRDQVKRLVEMAQPLLEAKAVCKVCYIDAKLEDAVVVSGIYFRSKVLRRHLDKVERVFPYVVTIGDGLEKRARTWEDFFGSYILDVIGNVAVTKARAHLEEELRNKFTLEGMATMSPGQIKDWPIQEQQPLFDLLGDVESSIGVRLEESLFMTPAKSISGIYFPTEVAFFTCQLCPKEGCSSRRAPYDERLAEEYGVRQKG